MAITLAQVSKLEKDPLRKGIIMNILRKGKLLEYVKFENVSALRSVAIRWTALPTVAFRKINADYTANEGDVDQIYENVYAFGGEIEHDRVWKMVASSLIVDPIRLNMDMKTAAMAYTFNNYYVNGDHATDPDGIVGIKVRLDNGPSRQKVQLGAASATAHDPTASVANALHFLWKFEQAAYRANRNEFDFILANEGVVTGLARILRAAGQTGGSLFDTTKDIFDRDVLTYRGKPLVDIGLKADQATEIITNTEVAADADADSTSLYFVPQNTDQGIMGIQLRNMETFPGKKQKSTTETTTIEWWIGLAGFGSYGATRLWNLEDPALWT